MDNLKAQNLNVAAFAFEMDRVSKDFGFKAEAAGSDLGERRDGGVGAAHLGGLSSPATVAALLATQEGNARG